MWQVRCALLERCSPTLYKHKPMLSQHQQPGHTALFTVQFPNPRTCPCLCAGLQDFWTDFTNAIDVFTIGEVLNGNTL